MLDYHIHTSLSDDSETPYYEMLDQACRLGLKEIAVTDHHDPDYTDPDYPFQLDFDKYHMMLETAIMDYHKKIEVKRGLELGIQKTCLDKCTACAKAYPYDFIIGSFHMSNGATIDMPEFYEGRSGLEIQESFYKYMLECLKDYNDYSVIGHINIVDRYQHLFLPGEPLNPPEVMEIIRAILEVVIYNGKGIEFNTSSFRYKTPITVPSPEILKAYKELGGEIITLGSDAHSPDYIAYNFKYAADMLESFGFKYVSTFKEMKPDFIKISHL